MLYDSCSYNMYNTIGNLINIFSYKWHFHKHRHRKRIIKFAEKNFLFLSFTTPSKTMKVRVGNQNSGIGSLCFKFKTG